MIKMIVTFCGHCDLVSDDSVRLWLYEIVEHLLEKGATKFHLGGYGNFDRIAASVVWELKQQYPQIISVLVLPYLDRKVDAKRYDYTTYPPLEAVPKRFAISRRNQWMVNEADVVVAYVTHTWGGAAATLEYGKRKKKEIVSYAECVNNHISHP